MMCVVIKVRSLYRWCVLVVVLLQAWDLQAQIDSSSTELNSRAAQIESERLKKDAGIPQNQPDVEPGGVHRFFAAVKRAPLWVQSDGLGPGYGIGLAAALHWEFPEEKVRTRLWGIYAVPNFYTAGANLWRDDFISRNVTLGFEAWHRDAPQLEYYGPGPDSSVHNRTDYRLEETPFGLNIEHRPNPQVASGCHLRELLINVGPGTNGSLPSTESVFGPAEAPGIDVQSNFAVAGCWAQLDLRDLPDDPHKGTFVFGGYDRYFAERSDVFSFNRVSAVVEQYIPFWNKKRVISLRGRTELSPHSENQTVPFYLEPTLGTDTDLRGFARYRFYDQNLVSFNAEYHWEICSGIDAVLFADGGRVFNRPGQFQLTEMEGSFGFGFRFKRQNKVIARFDTGFSHEGFQIWLKFGKLY